MALRRPGPALRPRAGRALPRSLRVGRVDRVAADFPGGVSDPELGALLTRIEESPIHSGNDVEIFFRGADAFASMLDAVGAAEREILLESYILRDDGVGRQFQQALEMAVRRGVAVRVLADALGSIGTRRSFWRQLADAGIEVRLFHGLGVPLRFLKFRDHRKILVVDRRVSYTGGMNIGDEYGSSLLPRERLFRDTHARVMGPAALEMAGVFREGWLRARGRPFALEGGSAEKAGSAGILVLDSRPGRGAREVSAALSAIAGAARRRLWMTTAYFAPRTRVCEILGRVAARGVDVRLLLPGRSDVRLARHAGHGFFARLLARGVRVFEYQPAILHAKTLVADGSVSVIGSSNLDFRSFERNAECNFAIFDAGIGARMESQFEEDLANAVEIEIRGWRRRGWWHRAGDAAARRLSPLL
jgi:cardiolipin synthase A/B